MTFTPTTSRTVTALALVTAISVAPTSAQSPVEPKQTARAVLSKRIPHQQSFLIEYLGSHPEVGTSAAERLTWMDAAEKAFAAGRNGGAAEGHDRRSRAESFSPYVWSWLPMLVANGNPDDELSIRTHVERTIPALLADLETFAFEREPGACELLRIPDLGNGLAHVDRLARVDEDSLRRMHEAIARVPNVVAAMKARATATRISSPRHLDSALAQLRAFDRSLSVEIELRAGRLHSAWAKLAAMSVPGAVPSGFQAVVERLARRYHSRGESDAALATLDSGLLATTEGDWPAAELRELYLECGGSSASARFDLAWARRAPPLVASTTRFDLSSLRDLESGKPLAADELEGKTIVLDYVSRGCLPCLEAVPKMQTFAEQNPDIVVLAVVLGEPAQRPHVLESIRARGGRFGLVYDTENQHEHLRVFGTPSYVVVTPERFTLKPFGMRTQPTHLFADVAATLAPND